MLPNKLIPLFKNRSGSSLLAAIVLTAILLFMAGSVLYTVENRYQTTYQSSRWVEALNTAEAGAELALLDINMAGSIPTSLTGLTTSTTGLPSPFTMKYSGLLPAHGLVIPMYVSVLVAPITSNGQTWYRIRSTGITGFPGSIRGGDPAMLDNKNVKNHWSMLRHLNFTTDLTNGNISGPQVSRTVEVCAVPNAGPSIFSGAITTQQGISFDGGTWFDSFDSTDSNKSINGTTGTNGVYSGGQYPGKGASKTQSHGNIVSNVTQSLNTWGSQATPTVYGNAGCNGGVWPPVNAPNPWQHATITGTVSTACSTTFNTIVAPSWSAITPTPTQWVSPGNGVKITNLVGGVSTPNCYIFSQINVNGSDIAEITNPTGATQSSINIYVNGPTTVSGGGAIKVDAGVQATFYVYGNVNISGGGFVNAGGIAGNLVIYGIPASVGTFSFSITGGPTMTAAIYAPSYPFTLSGGTSLTGAGVFLNASIQGSGAVHYDEALAKLGGSSSSGSGFKVASWLEDIYSQKDNPATR